MKANLTDRTLEALGKKAAAPGKRYDVWDSKTPNFGVRVNDRGRRVFMVAKRLAGESNPTRFTVGEYPGLSLSEARRKARQIIEDLESGVRPQERHQALAREQARRRRDTFALVAEEFIKRHVSKLRTRADVERAIRRDLISRWDERPITEISRGDLLELLDEAVDAGHPYAAHHTFAYVHKLWEWAIERGVYGLESSPCDRMKPASVIGKKVPRQRVLRDDELRLIWQATEDDGGSGLAYPFGPLVRLLLITGQGLREVAEARWTEFDLDKALWTVPAERMKGDAAHEVSLSPMALDLLSALPRFAGGDFVFTTTAGAKPVSGFSKSKTRLDAMIAEAVGGPMATWVFHDLRRTMRTHLSALPVPDLVRELTIAHRKPGLHKVYDQHAYQAEKRHAMALWAERLAGIVEPRTANIVVLRAEARP